MSIRPAETNIFSLSMQRDFFKIIMPLTKAQKSEILKDLIKQIKDAKSTVFANFQGLSVKDTKDLRRRLREKGVNFKVSKKTLIRLAAKEAGFDEIPDDLFEGPIGAAFSNQDETAAANLIYNYSKTNKNIQLRGALFDGRVLSLDETRQLAQLPSKQELLSKFVYLVKYPIQGFHSVLYNTISGFVRALNCIKEQKGQIV